MYEQKVMDRCISFAKANPITSRGRTSISRMAAIITDYGNTIIIGVNKYKTHPMMLKFSKDHNRICLHAEIDALVQHQREEPGWTATLRDCDIYISRVLKNDTPALAKPCKTCFGALTYYGIRSIYWTK